MVWVPVYNQTEAYRGKVSTPPPEEEKKEVGSAEQFVPPDTPTYTAERLVPKEYGGGITDEGVGRGSSYYEPPQQQYPVETQTEIIQSPIRESAFAGGQTSSEVRRNAASAATFRKLAKLEGADTPAKQISLANKFSQNPASYISKYPQLMPEAIASGVRGGTIIITPQGIREVTNIRVVSPTQISYEGIGVRSSQSMRYESPNAPLIKEKTLKEYGKQIYTQAVTGKQPAQAVYSAFQIVKGKAEKGISFGFSKTEEIKTKFEKYPILKYTPPSAVLGFGTTVILGTASTIINPIKTTESLIANIPTKQFWTQQKLEFFKNPSYKVGEIAGIVYGGKIIKSGIISGTDILRTTGKTKLPSEIIIAPEYLKGQKYPKIIRGQTAGQLLSEFTPSKQIGVIRLTGFHAAEKPLTIKPIPELRTSELPALHIAPKLNPTYLRVHGENGGKFTLNPFKNLFPTAYKVNPVSYELLGVTPSQTTFQNLKSARKLFYSKEGTGKAYITFIKSEKEAQIPFGSGIRKLESKFYFKTEGRRIPLREIETFQIKKGFKKNNLILTEESAKKLYSRSYAVPKYSPLSLAGKYPSYSLSRKSSPITPVSSKQKVYQSKTSYLKSIISKIQVYKSQSDLLSSKNVPSKYLSYKNVQSYIAPYSRKSINGIEENQLLNSRSSILNNFLKLKRYNFVQLQQRRFGKWKDIGKPTEFLTAKQKGLEITRKTLGASFRLLEPATKKELSLGELPSSFRLSRVSPYVAVQLPRYRLSTRPEVSEIQYFKRRKGINKW